MKLTNLKKRLPFIVAATVSLTVVILLAAVFLNGQRSQNNGSDQIGKTPDTDPVYQKAAAEGTAQILASPDPFQAVARLILKLPYKGTNFSLDYSYDNNTFTLTYKKGFENQGNAEFNQLLLQYSVDKKYLSHLVTKSQ